MSADTTKGVRDDAFSDVIIREAERITSAYHIVMRQVAEGGFLATCAEIPVAIRRSSADEALIAARRAATIGVATYLEDGKSPPAPLELHPRSQQVNVRLSVVEVELLQQATKSGEFGSLSEFIRRAAIESATTLVRSS